MHLSLRYWRVPIILCDHHHEAGSERISVYINAGDEVSRILVDHLGSHPIFLPALSHEFSNDALIPQRPVAARKIAGITSLHINHSRLFIKENARIPQEPVHRQALPDQRLQGMGSVRDRVARV